MEQELHVDTKIAFSFFNLGRAYEDRQRYDLAIENYRKSLDYDPDLYIVKTSLQNLVQRIKKNQLVKQTVNKFIASQQALELFIA
jgi:tetratricopeptide (TPR) repeat protein